MSKPTMERLELAGAKPSASRPWTAADDTELAELYPTGYAWDIAIKLNRSYRAVRARAALLGIKKQGNDSPWRRK